MADDIATAPGAPAENSGYWQQPDFEHEVSEDGGSITVLYRGSYAELAAFARSFSPGSSAYEGDADYVLARRRLERSAGPSGLLTLVYTDTAEGTDEDGGAAARLRSVAWRLASTPADVSVYRYCGPSSSNANRARIERWWSAPGGDPASTISGLCEADQRIARKLLEGKEVVQRHFPTLVKTSVYGRGRIQPTGALDHYSASVAGAPEWMAGRAACWLKQQEDCELAPDKTQTLVEAWIGGDAFDPNFYGDGEARWAFGSI